jgi:hypothetical protein
MNQGVLLVAFNNEHVDYVNIAAWNAQRIHQYLNLPVAVITDSVDHAKLDIFDHVIHKHKPAAGQRYFHDLDSVVNWHNHDRSHSALLSPFDQTLMLDVDYVVNSNQLSCLFDIKQDFVCHRYAVNARTGEKFNTSFGKYNMPMYWATVMCFKRSLKCQVIFNMMQMVQSNWHHYRNLYGIQRPTFRNDHALSVALTLESGNTLNTFDIPWNLVSVLPEDELLCDNYTEFRLQWQDGQKRRYTVLKDQDFHAMGKSYLEKIIANQS